jgi:beta-N-acetylhexosaminidase
MRVVTSILLAAIFTTLCLSGSARVSSSSDIRGQITQVSPAEGRSGVLGQVLIEGRKEADTQVEKASVTVNTETRLFLLQGQERKPVEFAALQVGQLVEARFSGPVRESYPVQATAAAITILESER